jgi:colicin import membrane protein
MDRRKQELEDWRAEQERLKGLSEHLADQREQERVAAEKAAAEKAAAEKVAAEKAAAEKAAADKAARDRVAAPSEPSPDDQPGAATLQSPGDAGARAGRDGNEAAPLPDAPTPPPRPKPARPEDKPAPTEGGLY